MARAPRRPRSRTAKAAARVSRAVQAAPAAGVNPRTGKPYSASYAKRIASAEARGKTRQEARGHRPGEARERRERERAEWEGLSKAEQAVVRRWALDRYGRNFKDYVKIDPDDALEWVKEIGYDNFREVKAEIRGLHNAYVRSIRDGTYVKGLYAGKLDELMGMYEPPDISWLYYH